MPLFGAHMSIAGGYYRAAERAAEAGCDCVQLFTKNNNQWRAKAITEDEAQRFRTELAERKIKHPLSHSSYLINLGSPDDELWKKSIDSMIVELRRAEQLGIPYVVVHPGAYTTSTEAKGIRRIVRALNEIHRQTKDIEAICLLETTAGQGSCLGCTFEQLAAMLDGVKQPERLGVCLDTCHVFAAGYALSPEKDFKTTMRAFGKLIGFPRLKAIHTNDSKAPFGSRKDRHEHIGEGQIGLEAFRLLVNDRRLAKVPMYLETEKGERDGVDLDVMNLSTLHGLVGKKG